MCLGKNIKKIRIHLGITQEQLAHELGISFSTINRWENGHTIPSRLAKQRLIDYCTQNKVEVITLEQLKNS